jgi:hypothetical protein
MTPEVMVRLKITSEVHPPEFISEALGMPCDRSWRIGDFRSMTTIQEKLNGWILNSGREKTVSLEEQIRALLDRLEPIKEKIRDALAEDIVEVSCVIYAGSVPALNFDSRVVTDISYLGASLDIDLYL